MEARLPPGPRAPRAVQTIGWWNRPLAYLERCRARYGGRLAGILSFGASPLSLLPPLRLPIGPWARFERLKGEVDELLRGLIAERRADETPRDDVLAMLLEARHEDGSPMTGDELRDE